MPYPTLDGNYRPLRSDLINVQDSAYGATGNGVSDDTAALNRAIAALPTNGGDVFLPIGKYIYSSDITLAGRTNIQIIGSGRGTILQAAANTQPNCFNLSGASHCTISDLQINGNKANVTQLATQYTALNGIYMHNSDDITITRCYIHDCYVSGIMANGGSSNIMISQCRMVANFDNQIYIRAQNTAPFTPCSNGTITGCVCSGGSFSGIQILGSSYFTITGNTCYGNGPTQAQGDGIGSEGASHITITGNVCYSNGIQGIQTRFTNEVGTNQISSHVTIIGNVCYNNTSPNGDNGGIGINDSEDVLAQGNLVFGNTFGININGGNGLGVTNCKLVNNTVRNNADTGIRINPGNASTFIVENNYCADNAMDNMYLAQRTHVMGGVYARAPANKEGIHCASGSDGTIINGCEIFDNADNGILIDSPVANVEIRNCYFDNITTASQKRALQEQAGAGPTRMVNCRIKNQANNPYTLNNVASRYYDEQTAGTATITTAYTVVANDEIVLCNQAAAITVTLPGAGNSNGRTLVIKDKSGNASTNNITVSGANTIDGAASKVINTNYGLLRIISDGANWFTL